MYLLDKILRNKKEVSIHFSGIGGIGMSALAAFLKVQDFCVQGSDSCHGKMTEKLRNMGIDVRIGEQGAETLKGAGAVVFSSAIGSSHPERVEALRLGLPLFHRSELLNWCLKPYCSIVVTGTHGKTTTTTMTASLLEAAGWDPTVFNGGIVSSWDSNLRMGKGKWCVAEADESDNSFLSYRPFITVLTNIDNDHMDFYKDVGVLYERFYDYVHGLSRSATVVGFCDDRAIREIFLSSPACCLVSYGLEEGLDYRAMNVRMEGNRGNFEVKFDVQKQGQPWLSFVSKALGTYNVVNALGAIVAADVAKVDIKGLLGFSFVLPQRRFTPCGRFLNKALVIDDYAHHPRSVEEVLLTVRSVVNACGRGQIWVVFQPHRYSRMALLKGEVACAFKEATGVFVTPIYGAGEEAIEGVSVGSIASSIERQSDCCVWKPGCYEALREQLVRVVEEGDMIIFMGAGDITSWARICGQDCEV